MAANYSSNHHRRQRGNQFFSSRSTIQIFNSLKQVNSKRVKCTNHVSRENERPYLTACTSRLKSEQKTFSNPTSSQQQQLTRSATTRPNGATGPFFFFNFFGAADVCGIATLLFYLLIVHTEIKSFHTQREITCIFFFCLDHKYGSAGPVVVEENPISFVQVGSFFSYTYVSMCVCVDSI